MSRKRANDAAAAFGRVGVASVGDPPDDSHEDSIPASENAGDDAGGTVSVLTGRSASAADSPRASDKAGRSASRKAGKAARRVGRPRGPERVALTVRILAANDARLTAAVETTGESPQYIVDAALGAYLDALGIPERPGR